MFVDVLYIWRWIRKFGVMVVRSWNLKRNILREQINYETIEFYKIWINKLQQEWRIILAIVCDGRRWIFQAFPWIPIQMCQSHQAEIIRRYIPKKTRIEANKELLDIVDSLPHISKQTFTVRLEDWCSRYSDFMKERNKNGWFKHKRTMSAYNSLKYHKQRLFTYEDYKWQIDIPTTTNSLESEFGHLKEVLWVHRWLRHRRKWKVIQHYLASH